MEIFSELHAPGCKIDIPREAQYPVASSCVRLKGGAHQKSTHKYEALHFSLPVLIHGLRQVNVIVTSMEVEVSGHPQPSANVGSRPKPTKNAPRRRVDAGVQLLVEFQSVPPPETELAMPDVPCQS